MVPAAYVEQVRLLTQRAPLDFQQPAQAHHNSIVKVVYDYEASAPGELTVHEDEILLVFETEEDWILVQSQKADGGAGYIPGTYVEAASLDDNEPLAPNRIVVPDSVSSWFAGCIFGRSKLAATSTCQHLCRSC